MPATTVHAVLAEALGPQLARPVPRLRRRPGGRRVASARSTARSGPTAARSPSRSSTRAPARRCSADLNQLARMARMFGVLRPGPGRQAAARRAQGADRGGARLPPRGRGPARFAAAYDGDPDFVVPDVLAGTDGAGHASGSRDSALAADRRRHPGASATVPAALRPLPVLRPGAGGAAARRPAPRQLPAAADGRLGVLDFGAVDRLPGGFSPRSATCSRSRSRDAAAVLDGPARRRGSYAPTWTWTPSCC